MNPESRFIGEIPQELIQPLHNVPQKRKTTPTAAPRMHPVQQPTLQSTGGEQHGWRVGDKAAHNKWGTGTVVSVKGAGDNMELDIAFPSPTGIKRLLAKFAPITKV
jgi:DNA helicase-2/ATP-dependent DNA helicase PcrA